MMNKQAIRQKIEKQHYARERHEQDLRHQIREEANTSGSKNQKEKMTFLENSPRKDDFITWQQILNRCWELTSGVKFLTKHLKEIIGATMPNKHIFPDIKWAITRSFKRKNLPLKRPQIKGLEISRTLLKTRMRMNSKSIHAFLTTLLVKKRT